MNLLTEEQIAEELPKAAGWARKDEKWIEKKYRFATFPLAISFVNEVAELAESYDHHPLIQIDWKLVTLKLSSWNAGGLTDLDLKMAREFNEIFDRMKASSSE